MPKYKFLLFVIAAIFVSSCAKTYSPTDTNLFGTSIVQDFRLPKGYDVYHIYSSVMSVRTGYEGMIAGSKDLAQNKCGKASDFNLVNIRIIPWRCCYPSLPPAQMANIQCVPFGKSQKPIFFDNLEKNKAEDECKNLGLKVSDKEFSLCVKELSS